MNRYNFNSRKNNQKLQKATVNNDLNDGQKKKLCPDRFIVCLKNRIKQIAEQKIRSKRSLAKPVNRNVDMPDESLSEPPTPKCEKKKTTLRIRNRIEQLAYPQVRKLIETKKQYKNFLKDKDEVFNKLLNESQSSYYSRLANIKPMTKPPRPQKWTEQDWKKHKRIAKKLAQPKKLVPPPPVEKVVKPFRELEESIEKLSKPKKVTIEERPCVQKWTLSAKLKDYEPSERIIKLGKPVDRKILINYKDPTKIEPSALSYTPTERIVELAKTKKHYEDIKPNPFNIPPKALRAKPSKRIIELAQPKEKDQKLAAKRKSKKTKKIRPTNVSKNALTAIPTNRILQLAKPKDQ